MATGEPRRVRPFVDEYTLPDGRRIHILAEGRLVNLSAAEGHPSAVMDMSFANQALSAEYMRTHAKELEHTVYTVPEEIDQPLLHSSWRRWREDRRPDRGAASLPGLLWQEGTKQLQIINKKRGGKTELSASLLSLLATVLHKRAKTLL
jgi:hypothetical protein